MNIQHKREPVLFIAYHFPPVGGPGVNRSLNFVKYLSESGYKPIVITISDDDLKYSDYPLDPSLLDQLPKGTEIIRVASGEPRRLRAFLLKIKLFRFAASYGFELTVPPSRPPLMRYPVGIFRFFSVTTLDRVWVNE